LSIAALLELTSLLLLPPIRPAELLRRPNATENIRLKFVGIGVDFLLHVTLIDGLGLGLGTNMSGHVPGRRRRRTLPLFLRLNLQARSTGLSFDGASKP
jgi:hypothetical protein